MNITIDQVLTEQNIFCFVSFLNSTFPDLKFEVSVTDCNKTVFESE